MSRYQIQRKRLAEQVAEQLEDDIRVGVYQPGDSLPSEKKIMDLFGVGRPSVREALFSLQKMGLIAISSGSPARVIAPTVDTLSKRLGSQVLELTLSAAGQVELQECRVLFEVAVVRLAAERVNESQAKKIRQALQANRETLGNDQAFKQSDIRLHEELVATTGNRMLAIVHESLVQLLDDRRAISLQSRGQDEIAYKAHQKICEAVLARDPERAELEMRRHLEQHYKAYRLMKDKTGRADIDTPTLPAT